MAWLKERTQASNSWLGEKFAERPKYVSNLVAQARQQKLPSHELAKLRGKEAT
jgi:hypothetical protein